MVQLCIQLLESNDPSIRKALPTYQLQRKWAQSTTGSEHLRGSKKDLRFRFLKTGSGMYDNPALALLVVFACF